MIHFAKGAADSKNDTVFREVINVFWEYEQKDDLTYKEMNVVGNIRDNMAEYGFLIYNGDKETVKLRYYR